MSQANDLLKLLKHQSLPPDMLSIVAHSLIVSRIFYALPSRGGFLSAELIGTVDALLSRQKRFGYIQHSHILLKLNWLVNIHPFTHDRLVLSRRLLLVSSWLSYYNIMVRL